jgi:hypothetical protein
VKTVIRRPANHGLHLFLTLITFGCWLPVWAVVAMIGRRETVTSSYAVYTTVPQHAYDSTYYPQPVPPSWSANEPYTQVYGGATYRWNPLTNRWDRSH